LKNYYAILEVPVGCGVAEIRQAYRRLVQENLDNEAVFAELKEAHEVLTTPARRADYDRAVWGETFAEEPTPGSFHADSSPGGKGEDTLTPPSFLGKGAGGLDPTPPLSGTGAGRCPMGAEAQCPVLLGRAGSADTYCPECGYLLAALSTASGFDQADGADGAARLEEPGGRSHGLRPGLNMVGRESADVLLPDKTVSRQHARLEVSDDGTVTLEDLSSTNGTQVGGDVLVPHMARTLQSGDRVRFGSVALVLHLPAQGQEPARETAQPPSDQERPAAERARAYFPEPGGPVPPSHGNARAQVVETREEGGRAYPLVPGVTTFGRRAENSVVIQGDPYVSGSHAQIIADGDVFRLTDVGSTNGTLLNGRRLAINEPETLTPEDVILIGGTAMRFEMLDVPEQAASEEAVAEEKPLVEAADTEAPQTEAPKIGTEDAPAEPPQRTAQEYDVPDDDADNGIPTRAARPHDSPAHDSPKQDSPTNVER